MNNTPSFYQDVKGFIRIVYGGSTTKLTKEQINELHIDVYSLDSFDHDLFMRAYHPFDDGLDNSIIGALP